MKSKVAIFVIVFLLESIGFAKAKDGVIRYSSKIIHENKMYPSLSGQSYTNYHFDTSNIMRPQVQQTSNDIRKSPRAQTYLYNDQHDQYEEPKLFNVGYTITFSNNPNHHVPNPNGRADDVIIGTRSTNEMPLRPSSLPPSPTATPSEEIVLNEFLDGKKRKLSGIKPKYYRPLTHGLNTKHLLAQANLSPKTQMKLAELQTFESTTSSSKNGATEWKPLSSGVEIYHSSNVYVPNSDNYYVNVNGLHNNPSFNHAEALKKSLSFDSSNAAVPQYYQRYRRHFN